ncbi:MAG TPA: hypothetical protein VL727_07430 [Puia sp.]|nr:hypothetical protein [Puia sp.]
MFCKRNLSLLAILLFLCQATNAQFGKLINKAKEKALEKVTGKKPDTTAAGPKAVDTTGSFNGGAPASDGSQSPDGDASSPSGKATNKYTPPAPIQFPHTGVTVKAIHATMASVIDGDIDRIASTPQGKFFFDQARQKGLKGSDVEIFRQAMNQKNAALMEEIEEAVKEKFPTADDDASAARASKMGNPAWGGVSAPSLYFEFMVGSFDTWITSRYVKTTLKHDHVTMADVFGANVTSIMDLDKHLIYAMASVLGVNYTKVDTIHNIYRTLSMVKEEYLGIPGIKIEPGKAGKFGDYNTVSERITIPVQPYIEKESGKKSDGLLKMHDILSNRNDGPGEDGQMHYSPGYKLVFEYYFTHDLDKYLPESVKRIQTGVLGSEGQCIGAALKDENGNSAVWRLIDVQTNQDIDEGEFQVPADYPVMTKEQRRQAIRARMGLKTK